ncbi:uncharacterized protein LOC134072614 [Sardina pilchardus]|uniref:uncharacterized protein LOC134072614 n=1 Tax=Sardina pilchardus TaxID=27697 RepID=UPI002E0D1003
MVSGTSFWWLGLYLSLAAPYSSSVTYPDYVHDYVHSLRLPEDTPPEGHYKGPWRMGFTSVAVRPNSLVYSKKYTKSAAVNIKPSSAGQPSGRNIPNQGSPSSWGPVHSSRNYGPSSLTAVDGSTSTANHRPVTSQSSGNTGYRPGAGQSKGSGSYRPTTQPPKPEVYSQYRPYPAKLTPGKDEHVKQVLVRPNPPAWSTKHSSAAVGQSSGVHYKPVTSPSRGSMGYRPVNQQLKPSTSSGQYRPYEAKPMDIKQVLVRPNSPVGGSTSSVHKPVTSPSRGSVGYRPANQQLQSSTSSIQAQYRPYSAKPDQAKWVPVRPQSSASSAMTPSGSFGSAQAQWAQPEAASSTYGQTGQPTWQSQAASMSYSSQNSVSQSHGASHSSGHAGSHGGYEPENPHTVGASQQGEDSILTVIPSHLGSGVIETISPAERKRMRPATPNKGQGFLTYMKRI